MPIEEELRKEMYVSGNFYNKVSVTKNKSKFIYFDNNVIDAVINIDDEFIKKNKSKEKK